ncbi:MAG: AAA family ATPase [Verrucomicrobia bacterium]|nr:AAA family ATPase [Verrucomicrobiota bacterium]
MSLIEGIKIRNYRALREVSLGHFWNDKSGKPLSSMTVVIGKNGVGKSSLFDAFGFLADCLRTGVEEACDSRGRGGFHRIRSRGQSGPIEFEVYYRGEGFASPITYELSIDLDRQGRPYIARERLRQRRRGQTTGRPLSFLWLQNGKGLVWKGATATASKSIDTDAAEFDFESLIQGAVESADTESVELEDKRRLGIATLGALKQHPRIAAFRRFIEGWYLSYFTPDAARSLPLAGPQKQLNAKGDNLGNVVQFMEREHRAKFQRILDRIATKIPGITKIDTHKSDDGRLLLRFNNQGFTDPFYAQEMSDGTLKIFAYLLLLEDPTPPPFIGIEEPENGLYHKLLESLAVEFRTFAKARRNNSQVFVTTHQPYFVNALLPEEVWILEKGNDGFSTIRRASEHPLVNAMVEQGLPLGGLWYSDYLESK